MDAVTYHSVNVVLPNEHMFGSSMMLYATECWIYDMRGAMGVIWHNRSSGKGDTSGA
jgi:hypothetical protein